MTIRNNNVLIYRDYRVASGYSNIPIGISADNTRFGAWVTVYCRDKRKSNKNKTITKEAARTKRQRTEKQEIIIQQHQQ